MIRLDFVYKAQREGNLDKYLRLISNENKNLYIEFLNNEIDEIRKNISKSDFELVKKKKEIEKIEAENLSKKDEDKIKIIPINMEFVNSGLKVLNKKIEEKKTLIKTIQDSMVAYD